MGLSMRETGKMTCRMGLELKHGLMALNTKGTTKKEKSMVKEPMFGQTALSMLVLGKRTK